MKLIDIVNQIGVFQIGAGALILLTLIQIAPIKINPWSWLPSYTQCFLPQTYLQ